MAYAPSEDSDQPGHPLGLIRVFTAHMKKLWVLSYPLSSQQRLNLRWVQRSVCWFCREAAQMFSFLLQRQKHCLNLNLNRSLHIQRNKQKTEQLQVSIFPNLLQVKMVFYQPKSINKHCIIHIHKNQFQIIQMTRQGPMIKTKQTWMQNLKMVVAKA